MTRPEPDEFVIVGSGGHGREVLDIVDSCGLRHKFVGFVDDADPDELTSLRLANRSAPIVGDIGWLAKSPLSHVLGIGAALARRDIQERLDHRPALTIVHPTATIGSAVTLAEGVVVGARAVITTNVSIGHHTHLNVGSAVQHDSILGDFVTVSPGVFINGDVRVGHDVFLGTGAIVTRGCVVGDGAVIGAGSVVLSDVAAGSRVWGIPARPRQ